MGIRLPGRIRGQKGTPRKKTRRFLRLRPWALGVLVDSGVSIRANATGDPPGERIVELRLSKESPFDAWK